MDLNQLDQSKMVDQQRANQFAVGVVVAMLVSCAVLMLTKAPAAALVLGSGATAAGAIGLQVWQRKQNAVMGATWVTKSRQLGATLIGGACVMLPQLFALGILAAK